MDAGKFLWNISRGNWGIATETKTYDATPEPEDAIFDLVDAADVSSVQRVVPSWFSLTAGYSASAANVGPLILRASDASSEILNIPLYYNATAPIFVRFGASLVNHIPVGLGVEFFITGIVSTTFTATMGYYLIPV